jgi:hypothetical protein
VYKKNGYYWRSRRDGSKVKTEYVGVGYFASLLAQIDQAEREKLAAERTARLKEAAAYQALDDEINTLHGVVETLTAAAMLAAGYHKHKRQWRKSR